MTEAPPAGSRPVYHLRQELRAAMARGEAPEAAAARIARTYRTLRFETAWALIETLAREEGGAAELPWAVRLAARLARKARPDARARVASRAQADPVLAPLLAALDRDPGRA